MVRQIGTLAFVVTLVVVGLPVTAQAEGERPTASPQRVLTWHGQPLSTVLGDAGHARTSPKWSGGAHDPVVLFVAQDRAGEQQAEETQGMSPAQEGADWHGYRCRCWGRFWSVRRSLILCQRNRCQLR